jgi:MFS family permease
MQLLRGNRSFRRLWVGQVISELGNWFNFIAVLGLVRVVSKAAPEATTILLVMRIAPFALSAPLAGAVVDRWSRRTVMIVSDLARVVVSLGFLLVSGPEDLWIAYTCTVFLTLFFAFFEAAKNAAMPNLTSDEGLLAGNALMYSTRFLLMTIGAALGGLTAARFGYKAAFIINAVSFLASAYSVWSLSEKETRQVEAVDETSETQEARVERAERLSFWRELNEGWAFILKHPIVMAIIGCNLLWATGGGAINLVADRLGGVVFAEREGLQSDTGVAVLYAAAGFGFCIGMLLARRVGAHVELHGLTVKFIGWTLFLHGIVYASAGLMPTLWLASLMIFFSRVLIGAEFAVQQTLLMRLLPDNIRGRVMTTDNAAELSLMSLTTIIAGWSLGFITPQTLTIISGLLSATPGVFWLVLFTLGRLHLPRHVEGTPIKGETADALLPSAG